MFARQWRQGNNGNGWNKKQGWMYMNQNEFKNWVMDLNTKTQVHFHIAPLSSQLQKTMSFLLDDQQGIHAEASTR
jgi:hypothetical protein